MNRIAFTDLAIRRLPHPGAGQKRYWDATTPGFGLLVGKRIKTFMCMVGRERRLKTIARLGEKSLAEARREAKAILATYTGRNRSTSFSDARTAYLQECKTKNRPATVYQYERFLNALDFNGRVEEITRQDLKDLLADPHSVISFKVFFNWCIKNDLIDRNPLAGDRAQYNPSRTRVLTTDELKQVWAYEHAPFSDIIKLLLLTGQRRTEISSLKEEWITDVMTFPGSVTKNKKEHTIPYGDLTKRYLKPFAFTAWSKAKKQMDRHVEIPHWTLHDLRRTFSTVHAQLGTPIHVTEKLLNHTSGTISGVAAIYNQHSYFKEMQAAVETYESHIATILGLGQSST